MKTFRTRVLAAALVATLAASAWLAFRPGADDASVVVAPVAARTRAAAAAPGPAPQRAAGYSNRDPARGTATAAAASWPSRWQRDAESNWPDLTSPARAAWSAPPAPPPLPAATTTAAAERPVAPPFPYTLIGRWADEAVGSERTLLLLAGPLRVQTVAPGDVLDGAWRIDLADGTAVTATYLPLATTQTLAQASP